MTQDDKNAAVSAVERNLGDIEQRRDRLRVTGAATDDPSRQQVPPGDSPPMDLATASARSTMRMAAVLDQFSADVVSDIRRAGRQIARLRDSTVRGGVGEEAAPPPHPRARADAIDVEVVEVTTSKPTTL